MSFCRYPSRIVGTFHALVVPVLFSVFIFGGAKPAAAKQIEFLPNGGIRYTLTQDDFVFNQVSDDENFRYIDSSTGFVNMGLCVKDDIPISALRHSLDRLNSLVAIGATGDRLGSVASSAGDNISYCIKHGQSHDLFKTAVVHFAAPGRVSVRITYTSEGLYAGDDTQIRSVELQRIFEAVLFLETFSDDSDDGVSGSSASIENISGLPRVADLPHKNRGSGFGRQVRSIDRESQTTIKDFNIDERSSAMLKIKNKAFGVALRIDSVELTYSPF